MKRKLSSDQTEETSQVEVSRCNLEVEAAHRCRSGTTVHNIRVAHIRRDRYADLEDWMNHEDNIYIGRGGILLLRGRRFPPEDSSWANPFKPGRDGTRQVVLEKFESYIRKKIQRNNLEDELKALRGKNLGCWCVPQTTCSYSRSSAGNVCHGQVILKLLDELND